MLGQDRCPNVLDLRFYCYKIDGIEKESTF
jgi:hypothetical protein